MRKKLIGKDEEALDFLDNCEDCIWACAFGFLVYEILNKPVGMLQTMIHVLFWILAAICMFYVTTAQDCVGDVWIFVDEGDVEDEM